MFISACCFKKCVLWHHKILNSSFWLRKKWGWTKGGHLFSSCVAKFLWLTRQGGGGETDSDTKRVWYKVPEDWQHHECCSFTLWSGPNCYESSSMGSNGANHTVRHAESGGETDTQRQESLPSSLSSFLLWRRNYLLWNKPHKHEWNLFKADVTKELGKMGKE